jgi:preprotein translocase subunit SecA
MIKLVAERTVTSFSLDDAISSADKLSLTLKLQDLFGNLPSVEAIKATGDQTISASEWTETVTDEALERLEARDAAITPEIFREAERQILLWNVDQKWMDHIDQMDQMRYSIGMRSVGQKDPVVEYRMEGSEMFDEMNIAIQNDTVRLIMKANISTGEKLESKSKVKSVQEGHGGTGFAGAPAHEGATASAGGEATALEPAKRDAQKVGRNDLCPCGSGKKYKNCHGKE